MGLIKSKGNMYDFVTHTWNPIKGKCVHDCVYCYMKKWGEQKPLRLDENEMQTDLGKGNIIFVGSSCDMFAEDVYSTWIERVLAYCRDYDNQYLFQSKNPARFFDYDNQFPEVTIFGTTIESNRDYPEISNVAANIQERMLAMDGLKRQDHRVMVTIEPVLDFDVEELIEIIEYIEPDWVNLGADSGSNKLPEPSKEKLLELMDRIDIRQKKNLKRLLK